MRKEGFIRANSGMGYWLGIIGCTLMLLLLQYSLSKRIALLRRALSIKHWFQLHMALGVIGPLCIIFHSNFHLGSVNSSVALFSMLLVAGSGLIGRYIYIHIHAGLYGERIRLNQAISDMQTILVHLMDLSTHSRQQSAYKELANDIEQLGNSLTGQNPLTRLDRKKLSQKILKRTKKLIYSIDNGQKHKPLPDAMKNVQKKLREDYIILAAILKKLPSLKLFEKLFSLWHVVHIPIFVLMLASAVVHIVVVHMY